MNPLVWMPLESEKSMGRRIKSAARQGIGRIGLVIPETGAPSRWEKAFGWGCSLVQDEGMTLEALSLPLPVEKWQQEQVTLWLSSAPDAGVKTVMLHPEIPEEEFLEIQAASNVAALCDKVEEHGLSLLIETAGPLTSYKSMNNFLTCVGRDILKIAWNVHNTFLHEPLYSRPNRVADALAQNIGLVVVRDSLIKAGIQSFRLLGFGDVPVLDSIKALLDAGVTSDLSFWVDCPPALEGEEALYHCIRMMEMVQKLV